MTLTSLRSRALVLSMLVAATAALALPTTASAILVGMESNQELANSDRTPELQGEALDKMQKQGVQVVRANFAWKEIATPACAGQTPEQLKDNTNPCYDWKIVDSLVTLTKARKQQLMLSFSRTPQFVLGNGEGMFVGSTPAQFNTFVTHYAAFMTAAGTRYRSGSATGPVKYWTIWNEPNSATFWKPRPNARNYAQLYGKAAVALKTANPTALIAPGPTNPNAPVAPSIRPLLFIKDFLKAAPAYLPGSIAVKRRYINAFAHNPYPGFNNQPSVPSTVAHPNTIGIANLSRLTGALDASPLTRNTRIWATEFGWETSGPFSTTLARQAQFIPEAFDLLDAARRVDIGISYGLTDAKALGDFQAGTFTINGKPKPSYKSFQRMVSVPQGGLTGRIKKGTTVNLWGRSNLKPTKGVIAYRLPGKPWTLVAGQKRAFDGSIRAKMRLTTPTIQFAVYDGTLLAGAGDTGYGPARAIRTF